MNRIRTMTTLVVISFGACTYSQSQKIGSTLLVHVNVNGKLATFMLDTGAEHSIIDRDFARGNGLRTAGKNRIERPTGSDDSEMALISDLQAEGLHARNIQMPTDSFQTESRALGVRLDGVLGDDLLRKVVMTIDFAEGSVHFNKHAMARGVPVHLEDFGSGALIHVRVNNSEFRLLLDTGANLTTISKTSVENFRTVFDPKKTIDGLRTSSSASPSALTCAHTVQIANQTVHHFPVRLAPAASTGFIAARKIDGLLGSDFLSRFRVELDLAHEVMYLKTDARFIPDVLQYSTLGIQFVKDTEGLFTIVAVWSPSPAEESGLVIGDRIREINGQRVEGMSLDQMSQAIHLSPGSKIRLAVLFGNVESETTVVTRQLTCSQ